MIGLTARDSRRANGPSIISAFSYSGPTTRPRASEGAGAAPICSTPPRRVPIEQECSSRGLPIAGPLDHPCGQDAPAVPFAMLQAGEGGPICQRGLAGQDEPWRLGTGSDRHGTYVIQAPGHLI
jgi:hypothetical protein